MSTVQQLLHTVTHRLERGSRGGFDTKHRPRAVGYPIRLSQIELKVFEFCSTVSYSGTSDLRKPSREWRNNGAEKTISNALLKARNACSNIASFQKLGHC